MEHQSTTQSDTKAVNIYPSKFKIVLSIVLMAMTFWSSLTSLFDGETMFLLKLILLPTTLISGYVLYFLVKKLYKKEPSLIIDEKGIYDDVLPVSIDQITWDEIKSVEVYTFESEIPFFEQQHLGIIVNDPTSFQQRLNFVQQKIFKLNHWFPKFKAQINLPVYLLDTNAAMVIEHIKAFHPEKVIEETKK